MTSLTTLFVVGPEEYVEFNESMGSKAFLEHVWDESATPLDRKGECCDLRRRTTHSYCADTSAAGVRLHSAGARIAGEPPQIEFPTVLRRRGHGNAYKRSGRFVSWAELHRQNPLAVAPPPDLAEYRRRGAQVGHGVKVEPGAWLEHRRVVVSDDGWLDTEGGSRESIYAAPRTAAGASASAEPATRGGQGRRLAPGSMSEALGLQNLSLDERRRSVATSSDEEQHSPRPDGASTPGQTPARRNGRSLFERLGMDPPTPPTPRPAQTTPKRPTNLRLPIPSPSTLPAQPQRTPVARTPLSATHPLPETPLKYSHRSDGPGDQLEPSTPGAVWGSLPAQSPGPGHPRGLGLGGIFSPVTATRALEAAPTAPGSGVRIDDAARIIKEDDVTATSKDTNPINAMLAKLRLAKSGLTSPAAGSGASRWAVASPSLAPLPELTPHVAAQTAAPEVSPVLATSVPDALGVHVDPQSSHSPVDAGPAEPLQDGADHESNVTPDVTSVPAAVETLAEQRVASLPPSPASVNHSLPDEDAPGTPPRSPDMRRVANWGLVNDEAPPATPVEDSPVLALPPGFTSNPLRTPSPPASPAVTPSPTPNSAKKIHPTAWADDDSDGDSLPDLPEEWITTSLSVSASTPMLGTSTRTRGSTIDDDACSSVSESIGASERPARRKNKRGGAKRKGRASSGEAALADAPARGVSNRDGGRAPGAASNGTDMGLRIAGRAALASSQHSSAGSMQPPSAPNSMRRAPTAPVREPAPHRDGSRLRAASPPRGPRAEQTSRARPSQVREAPSHDSRARPPAMRGSRASAPPPSTSQAAAPAPRARPHGRPKLAGDAAFARLAGAALPPTSLGAPAANERGGRRLRAASEAPAA
ncbi:hypothetical protein FA09DRAFT_331866 [Tilletiopsis washingtonensis]|uniref:Uncharacterized protein n=1 Tax=Tilletiopsis washingtonensis TaxID=58919 RepID=A0A316Z2C5_9BASI|nr:hypothetical protein FA09DRAFT_331866 [Tilletiopsis washingtonensis]PWN95940.1 hypothetical protein FA09DRAFT_331866 [Tilletiopsis washingtonensis]